QRRPDPDRADRLQRQLLQARRHPTGHVALGRPGRPDLPPAPGVPSVGRRHLLRRPQRQRPAGEEQRGEDGRQGFDNFDPTVWTQYFGLIEKSAVSVPWLFATGNHDMEALYDNNAAPGGAAHGYAGHAARLDLPRTGPSGCPSVNSTVYGNVGVLSLDANDLSTEIPTNAGYSRGAQLSWLTRRLGELRADPDVDFVVAFFHHCAYATSTAHASDAGVRAALAPLFDRFAVDLVVQGHNHQYERTDPISGGVATRAAPDGAGVEAARDGTTYICCGSGGR